MTHQESSILDKKMNGVTWRIILTGVGIAITAFIWTGKQYNSIILAIEKGSSYNAVQDVQIKALQVQVDKQQIEIDQLKLIINH